MHTAPNSHDFLRLIVGERHLVFFSALLLFHIMAGIVCAIAGAVAALSKKAQGRHSHFGRIYFWGLLVVFASAAGMSVLRWPRDNDLLALGVVSFGVASVGYLSRKFQWPAWTSFHIIGMGVSYIVLLTAFYVDNGASLPLWNRLSTIAYWTLPGIVGLPLVVITLLRHTRFCDDISAASYTAVRVLSDPVRRFRRKTSP